MIDSSGGGSGSRDMPGQTMTNSILTRGGAKTAWFKDTEGNILAVSQRIQERV
jgi:hypothetical protein